ncbi:MAG: hypothetical protein R2749_10755 [Acidimicrobiales bacterium]
MQPPRSASWSAPTPTPGPPPPRPRTARYEAARWRRPGGPGETGDPGNLRRRGLGSLAPRSAYLLFAVALLAFPRLFGTPTDARQWASGCATPWSPSGLDIAWGYGGMLALGQGLFFGLGAYAMAMHLSLEQVPDGSLPSFMSLYSDSTELPLLWRPFQSFWATIIAAVVVPAVVAALLGLLVFKRRIRGPYFALLTQATAVIFALVLIGNLKLTAGFNGLTGFSTVFGRNKYAPRPTAGCTTWPPSCCWWCWGWPCWWSAAATASCCRPPATARTGCASSATTRPWSRPSASSSPRPWPALPAVAAPVFGIVSPGQFDYAPSILMICWVAVGGRGKLWEAVLGALVVNWTRVTVSRPADDWQYLQGALFVVILAFAPGGFAGLLTAGWERLRHRLQPGRAGSGDRIVLEEAPA